MSIEVPPVRWRTDARQPSAYQLLHAEGYGYDPDAVALAFERIAAAEHHEPRMTAELIAALPDGVRLDGLEHRLKSPKSLARKIDLKIAAGYDPREAVERIHDVTRYFTITPDAAELSASAVAVTGSLTAAGWRVLEAEHSFVDGSRYKGMAAVFRHPSGHDVEVQFHTATSIDIKLKTHEMYNAIRDDATPLRVRERFFDLCVAMSEDIPTPPGLDGLQLGGQPVEAKTYARPCCPTKAVLDVGLNVGASSAKGVDAVRTPSPPVDQTNPANRRGPRHSRPRPRRRPIGRGSGPDASQGGAREQ